MDLTRLTIRRIADGLRKKEWTSREVTEACLKVADRNAATTHAYVATLADPALAAADAADRRFRDSNPLSDIDGIPVAVKDNMLVQGARATAASGILRDYVAPYDATVVAKLKRAGAVIVGKTNMDEFAMGSSTETSVHGPTRNPWDISKIPGGSSGGSAVAVAEGSAIASLGSDTGGSIRQPAAMCGVVGMKPTYGRVSRYGLMAMASSLDQIGPFARTVEDAAILLRAIEGKDPLDSTSVTPPAGAAIAVQRGSLEGVRIGMPKEYFVSGMEAGVEASVRAAIAVLEDCGAEIKEVSLPHVDHALAVYYVLMPCEVSANLARYDGIRYGTRQRAEALDATYRVSRGRGFGREVRRRIMLGSYALSAGYYDAYYLQALKVRRLISDDFTDAFRSVDCMVTPTSPTVAWNIGERFDDPMSMYLADVYTVSVNVAGLPAVSIPCGFSKGLPVGLQVIGPHFGENGILRVASAFEDADGGHEKYSPPSR